MNKKVSITGCGRLGIHIAVHLSGLGFDVKGSTTRAEKFGMMEANGIKPYVINFNPELITYPYDFFDADALIINIPPPRRESVYPYHLRQVMSFIEQILMHNIKEVIFVSSTSVYGNAAGTVTEETEPAPETKGSKAILKAEELFLKSNEFKTTVFRLGGLFGYDFNPARSLSGRKDIPDGNAPVNLVHVDDAARAAAAVLTCNARPGVYNVCSPVHPTRRDFYTTAALKFNLPLPEFSDDKGGEYKTVSSSRLIDNLDFKFLYNSPFDMLPDQV